MVSSSCTFTFLVAVILSYLQGSFADDTAASSISRDRRDIPMFRMGRSLHLIRMGRSFEDRAAGPRMGREEDDDEYRQALLNQIMDDANTKSSQSDDEIVPLEEDNEQKDRAIPYPRVGRALGLIRMGKRDDEVKRALGMIRMGKKALGMIRMGRGLGMIRMGRSSDKRGLGMIRMGKKDDEKRGLGMIRMGKRSGEAESD